MKMNLFSSKILRQIFIACAAVFLLLQSPALFARAGGGRSFGKSSPSYRRAAPADSHPSAPRRPEPQHSQNNSAPQKPGPQKTGLFSGGLFKGIAGGLVGGMLGSMLFSSFGLGHGGSLFGGGGIGIIEILLIGGLIFFLIRKFKSKQEPQYAAPVAAGPSSYENANPVYYAPLETAQVSAPRLEEPPVARYKMFANDHRPIHGDEASEIFFKVQSGWTKKDLAHLEDVLTFEMKDLLTKDAIELKNKGLTNHIENIAVRSVEIGEPWAEGPTTFCKATFKASLLDYTTDDRSGQVVDGSNKIPVKFEEEWLFEKASGQNYQNWKLAGIDQRPTA